MRHNRSAERPRAVALIVNPLAGGGKARGGCARACEVLRARGVDHACFETSPDQGDAAPATSALDAGFHEIWVVGGDGTVKESLQSIVDAGAILGVVPAGTSNCLATELGTPPGIEAAVEWLLAQPIGRADLGCCNGELFAVRVGTGAEAVAARISERDKRGVGPFAYALAAIRAIHESQPVSMTVRTQGELVYQGPAAASIISNVALHPLLRFVGRERVEPDDGLLHITVVRDAAIWAHFTDWLMGAAHGEPHLAQITEHLAPSFEIDIAGGVEVHLDGQSLGALTHLAIECLPRHIKVRGGFGPEDEQEG